MVELRRQHANDGDTKANCRCRRDLATEGVKEDPRRPRNYPGKPVNYCERQGRCNVGCLPGARHTLNKQLMAAIFGKIDGTPPLFNDKDDKEYRRFHLQPLTEVHFRPISVRLPSCVNS